MTEAIETTPAPNAAEEPIAAPDNPVVNRCMNAWNRAYKTEFEKCEDQNDAVNAAEIAYRDAMPTLSGFENIRDFIACVAHAMLIGAISGNQGTRLLYAAQVALTTVRRQPATPTQAA
ncbi:MAG: hypothetical protein ABR990_13715 [Terracidiphilus sp.]|jgi:hypothetical protein